MGRKIGTVEIRDTNDYLIHDIKPDSQTDIILDVVNGLDETVDVEFIASRDDDVDMSESVVVETGKNVPTADSGHFTFDEPWERIGVRLSCNQTPATGQVEVYIVG